MESIKQYCVVLNVGLLGAFSLGFFPKISANYNFYFHSHGLGIYKNLTK